MKKMKAAQEGPICIHNDFQNFACVHACNSLSMNCNNSLLGTLQITCKSSLILPIFNVKHLKFQSVK